MTNEVTGLIVDRDDHEAMAVAAIRLLNDNELALRLARNAHQSSRKFTWPYIRDEWLKLYRELADAKSFLLNTDSQSVIYPHETGLS